MKSGQTPSFTLSLLTWSLLQSFAYSTPTPPALDNRDINPLDGGPEYTARVLRDRKYLPAQIGGIVGAYALSLVLVAITLLSLAKKRREHLNAGDEDFDFEFEVDQSQDLYSPAFPPAEFETLADPAAGDVPNFSYPSPIKTDFPASTPYIYPSPTCAALAPGVHPSVDQSVVEVDRAMAANQLEEMYKLVMEQEEAKKKGIAFETPAALSVMHQQKESASDKSSVKTTLSKKERSKPANLNLSGAREEKTQSRTSSLFSALRSPRKKPVKGVSISSPIMTPMSGTFPRFEAQEMGTIAPRQYAPPPPPPVPTNQLPLQVGHRNNGAPMTPDMSPQSVMSIDERLNTHYGSSLQTRNISQAPTEVDPDSATSEHSQAPLFPNASSMAGTSRSRLPSLPASPKPGATFQRANAPSAVRTGGNLPLRAYEPALASPSAIASTTKQTVFERKGPLSPTTGRTPRTAGAVPYSPYQPFTPCVPVTPSLVTREDRKRMKRMVPKTPTIQMVKSSDEMW